MTYRGIGQTTFEMEPFGLIVGNPSQSPSSQCWHSGGKIAQSASVTQSPTGSVVVVVVGQATPEGCARHSSTSAGRPPRSQAGSTRCSPRPRCDAHAYGPLAVRLFIQATVSP